MFSDPHLEEREANRCSYYQANRDHDWRVNPNQVLSGGEIVEVKVLCPHCRTGNVMYAKRVYRNVNPSDPMTWRPYRNGPKAEL